MFSTPGVYGLGNNAYCLLSASIRSLVLNMVGVEDDGCISSNDLRLGCSNYLLLIL